jgi:hypothetical protein
MIVVNLWVPITKPAINMSSWFGSSIELKSKLQIIFEIGKYKMFLKISQLINKKFIFANDF